MTALEGTTTTSASCDDNVQWIRTTPSLEESMRKFGEEGYHVMVRYDPEREANNWTVVVGSGMKVKRADTYIPNILLDTWWMEKQSGARFSFFEEETCECGCLTREQVKQIVLDVLIEVGKGMEMKYSRDYQNRGFDD
jgi:hypothetical protein